MESSFQNNLVLRRRWMELRQKAIALLTCVFVYLVIRKRCHRRKISYSMSSERERVREEIMSQINTSDKSRNIIRMTPRAFLTLCS